ncbi:hypothetical protein [Halomonas sp.]|uniref:hypothetical protein n=1 Tax=Halomonas sp. TaxID=1486246 RepID=UPI003D143984
MAVLDRRPQRLDIHMMAGDPLRLVCPITDSAGDPSDLTGKTFRGGVKLRDGTELTIACTVDGNTVTAKLSREDSAKLGRSQPWGLEVLEDSDPEYGGVTLVAGTIYATEDVPSG